MVKLEYKNEKSLNQLKLLNLFIKHNNVNELSNKIKHKHTRKNKNTKTQKKRQFWKK